MVSLPLEGRVAERRRVGQLAHDVSTAWLRRRPPPAAAPLTLPSLPLLAMVGVGADEHVPAMVVEDDLVEIDLLRAAQRAGLVEALDLEWMVLEIEADHLGKGRHA